jgi:hypothetical protein
MSYEEWLEMRIQFEKDVKAMGELYRKNPFQFWNKATNVQRCSERQRAYLDKAAELREKDPFGVWE